MAWKHENYMVTSTFLAIEIIIIKGIQGILDIAAILSGIAITINKFNNI